MEKQLVVIGGGAAGFFCAVNAARLHIGLRVTILEKSGKVLSKVRVSGGGRCNLTHAETDRSVMSSSYPRGQHFVRKAFHGFFVEDTIRWFEERGVPLKTEPDGRMFPVSNSSQSVVDCLLREANRFAVQIQMHADVIKVSKSGNRFFIELRDGKKLSADRVCVACGGFPRMELFSWISELGHTIASPVPSLFTFNLPGHSLRELMGLSVDEVKMKITGTKLEETGPLLITHWGLSGPVVLRLSAWGARLLAEKNWQFPAVINWVGSNEQQFSATLLANRSSNATVKIKNKNPPPVPQRLWEALLNAAGVNPDCRWAELSSRELNRLVRICCSYEIQVKGKTNFKEEFVTAGGIQLSEVEPHTMQSKLVPGLFFAGEILDVDGITGGYNFQHAWTSGYLAAGSMFNDPAEA